jgi:hypothetical protein
MAKQVVDSGEQSRAESVRDEAKREQRTLPCAHAQGDKAITACGSATTDGDRCPLYREHGHNLVTGPGVSGGGTGHQLKANFGRGPAKRFFQYSKLGQICKFKSSAFQRSKIIQTLYDARFEYLEQFSQLG